MPREISCSQQPSEILILCDRYIPYSRRTSVPPPSELVT
jgi:hypothetical protein